MSKNENLNENESLNVDDVFQLINAEGERETIEHEGEYYLCAQPENTDNYTYSEEDEDAVPVLIFHCDFSEDDNESDHDYMDLVDDSDLLEILFDKFLAQLDEGEEEDDEDDDEDDAE